MLPQKCMKCFRLLLEYLAWIEHQFLSGIRDSRKAGSLCEMMRGVGRVRKSIHHRWLAKGLGLLCWGFKGFQEEIASEEASTLQIGSVAFPPGQYTSPQLHPWHRLFDQDRHQDISDTVNNHHHHHVVPLARIPLTLSRHFSLSFIASGISSGLHPITSHSCWMYVCAGRPAFARPYVGVHWSTSLMSSSLLFQQCPACLVCLNWIVFMMGGRLPYSWCLVGCCHQDLINMW